MFHSLGADHGDGNTCRELFESFADYEVLGHICAAKVLVSFKTMTTPVFEDTTICIPSAKYFGSIAFGCNMVPSCHTADDPSLKCAHVRFEGRDLHCDDNDVIIHFGFSIAVSFEPGNF